MSSYRKRIAILGATGYGGSELLRFLLFHPNVEVVRATSRQHPGKPVHTVHPHLLKVTELCFEDVSPEEAAEGVDLVFSALPHGASQDSVRRLPASVKAIDLSGDFRLKDPAVYRDVYGHEHNAPEQLGQFVYGLTEFNRRAIAPARRVANPGCFATAALLALLPLAHAGTLDGPVALVGVTGSSGSGAEPKSGTHHPERAEAFRAYKPLVHQHLPEICQELSRAGAPEARVAFVPHSAPMVRGIHITAILHPKEPLSLETVRSIYHSHYGDERFVRLRNEPPDVAVVAGSNFADLHCRSDGRTLVVLVALDNLVKGMVGQAIQNMNLMLGLPEHAGLQFPGTRP
ncbi:MAG: N-acetyl-gamma-glutamyl-phosphate reductase [Candidatus Wallbacteria bacterium]|nr:N-acetyl-gamma-glutamyl-phosphate reductase [Candidatus Wallbacteria bacterium]